MPLTTKINFFFFKSEVFRGFQFYPARRGQQMLIYDCKDGLGERSFSVTTDFSVHPYYTGTSDAYDIGVLRLPDEVGTAIGHAGYGTTTPISDLVKTEVTVTGYPGEKGMQMYSMKGPIMHGKHQRIFYDVDTSRGQSGSGVHVINTDSHPHVLAVHTQGVGW